MPKGNPNPKVMSYPLPRKFQQQLETEIERLGYYTKVECMGHILDFYFREHPDHKPEENPEPMKDEDKPIS